MEDWKKKYEETLRKAKEYYADVPGSREFLDNIFPELAEALGCCWIAGCEYGEEHAEELKLLI